MRHLEIVGADLAQIMDLANRAGRLALTTSVVHSADPATRAAISLRDPAATVVVCLERASELELLPRDTGLIVVLPKGAAPLPELPQALTAEEAPSRIIADLRRASSALYPMPPSTPHTPDMSTGSRLGRRHRRGSAGRGAR